MATAEGALPDRLHVPKQRRSSLLEPPTMSTPLRIVIFGHSGRRQFSLTEAILQQAVFDSAEPSAVLTTKTSGRVLDRNVALVNTPNLSSHDLFDYPLKKELKKAVCFSCPGPHAVLLTLDPLDESASACRGFKQALNYFGEQIVNNTVIVLYHEDEQLDQRVRKTPHFKELLAKCHRRCFVFSEKRNRAEGAVTMELLAEVDRMVAVHGIFENLEFKDADRRIEKEEKILQSQRREEVRATLAELTRRCSQEEMERVVERYKEQVRVENRDKAEVQVAERLGFALRLVDYAAAIVKGAFAGAVLSAATGFPGMAVGGAVGAALGGLLGGAVGALWSFGSNALARFW